MHIILAHDGQDGRQLDVISIRQIRQVLTPMVENAHSIVQRIRVADEMLGFLNERHALGQATVVIIDDIKRFARDVINHYALKFEVYHRGGRLESPLFHFEDSPEGKFRETIFAAQAELERTQNARQVRSRMKARLEQGLWAFSRIPPGYRYVRHPVHTKVLTLDVDRAHLVQEALQGFAGNRFGSVAEVYRFLKDRGFFGVFKSKDASRHILCVHRMLRHQLYTGYVEYPPWGVTLRKGYHPALITLKEHEQIRVKLEGRSTPQVRSDTKEDFPLRNYVTCSDCLHSLTGSWSKGRSKYYAYYHCYSLDCINYGKGVPKSKLEDEFQGFLKQLEVSDRVVDCAKRFAEEYWSKQHQQRSQTNAMISAEIAEIEKQIDRLSDRAGSTISDTMFRKLEAEIERLVRERCRLEETVTHANEPLVDFGTAFEKVRHVLKSPYETWIASDLHMKRTITRMMFPAPIPYSRNSGFGTADLSLPYRVIQVVAQSKFIMVDPSGLEPLTSSVQTRRSTK